MRMKSVALGGILALALSGCALMKAMQADMVLMDQSVAEFHQALDAGNPAAIVARAQISGNGGADLAALLTAARNKLGRIKSSSRNGFNDQSDNGAHRMSAAYHTIFERGEGTESFTFTVNSGVATLIGYRLDSTPPITNADLVPGPSAAPAARPLTPGPAPAPGSH